MTAPLVLIPWSVFRHPCCDFVKLPPPLLLVQGVDSGEMEVQRQGEEEEEELWKDRQNPREEERAERSTESTIHTVPELLLDTMQVLLCLNVGSKYCQSVIKVRP